MRPTRQSQGFTLIEVLLASSILAVAVLAIAQVAASGQAHTYDALHQERAILLAEAMIEEVLSLPFADPDGPSTPGPEAGENQRIDFDNADDFHGYSEDAGTLADAHDALYPALYQVFSRSVTCVTGTVNSPLGDPVPALTVTVTVADGTGREWTLTRVIVEPQ